MKIKDGLALRCVGNDYIVVEPNKGVTDMTKVFTLNKTAAWLWEQLAGEYFTEDSATELLTQQYDVEKEQATEDIRKLVEFLKSQNLLVDE